MTAQEAAAAWYQADYAKDWASKDGLAGLLQLPWRMSAAITGMARQPRAIADLGSGPGTVLAEYLTTFPDATGHWVDASPDMLEQARANLARFGGRVTFTIGDISELDKVDLPGDLDVITNSRVAHHFNPTDLTRFYAAAREHLTPQGWLVTLDHIRPEELWDKRFRTLLPTFAGPGAGKPTHPHYFPVPTIEEHLTSFADAGFGEFEMPWRAFYTCLFVGKNV
jgi:SAM-dependent methyltransferase